MTVGSSSLLLLKDLVKAILSDTLLSEASYVNHVLIRLFVLAHHPKLPSYQWSWVDIARRANVDPGNLALTLTSEFMKLISEKSWPSEKVQTTSTESHDRTLNSKTPPSLPAEHLHSLPPRTPFHC